MDLKTAISLIQSPRIISNTQTTWADFGSGSGLFTSALSILLQAGSKIIAVDKSVSALNKVNVTNGIILEKLPADFIKDVLPLRNLDGILMANALHFVKDKNAFIQKLQSYVNGDASFLIVEYDTNQSNPWVPYPLNVEGWQNFLQQQDIPVTKKLIAHLQFIAGPILWACGLVEFKTNIINTFVP